MTGTVKKTVSIDQENKAYIDAQIKTGGYASTSEVVRAGLRALQERDAAVERWLQNEVAGTYDAVQAGKTELHSADSVFNDLRNHHQATTKQ